MTNYEQRVAHYIEVLRHSISVSENEINESLRANDLRKQSIALDLEGIANAEQELRTWKELQEATEDHSHNE